jgi:hypothetical protein
MSTQLTEADNQFFLGLYRQAVAFYQPKIEKRTGVSLGKIDVWDYRQLDQHFVSDLKRGKYPWLVGFVRATALRSRLRKVSEHLKATHANRARNCCASYYKSAIYVSFSVDIRRHVEGIALTAVHELSHALWEKHEGIPLHEKRSGTMADQEKFRLLVEGFATYAERIWFVDLYPQCVKETMPYVQYDKASIHFRGLQRVQELVNQSGPQVLLEIPKRWRSL